MKILIAGNVELAPEDRDRALEGARELIDMAREEPGCLAYDWTADPFVPGRILIFELWSGEAELAEHFRARSYTGMLEHLGSIGMKGSEARKYRVDKEAPVYHEDGLPHADFAV